MARIQASATTSSAVPAKMLEPVEDEAAAVAAVAAVVMVMLGQPEVELVYRVCGGCLSICAVQCGLGHYSSLHV